MMNKYFCSKDLCEALKQKGFNEKTNTYYGKLLFSNDYEFKAEDACVDWNGYSDHTISAPSHEQAKGWLFSKGIFISIDCLYSEYSKEWLYFSKIVDLNKQETHTTFESSSIYDLGEQTIRNALKYVE